MKHLISLLLVVSMLMCCVPAMAELDPSTEATLVLQTWTLEAKDVLEQQITEFNKVYPNIHVKLEILSYNDYWQKMPIAIAGGAGPDIYVMTRANFDAYAYAGQALDFSEDLPQYPQLQESLAGMLPEVVDSYKFHGRQMGIPISVESTGIIFNKTLFEKAGVQLPSEVEDTWTWDDLRAMAQKLTVREGDETIQYGYYVPVNRMPTLEYIWAAGAELFTEDGTQAIFADESGVEAISFLNTLMNEDKVSPTVAYTEAQSASELFYSGRIAMMNVNCANLSGYREITDFEWDVAEMPVHPTTGKRYASSNVLGYIIGPNTKNKEAALTLLGFLSSEKMQGIFSEKGVYIPACVNVQEQYFSNETPENLMALCRALYYTKPLVFSEYLPYQQFLSVLYDAMTNMFNGVEAPADALTRAQTEMNAIIADNMD